MVVRPCAIKLASVPRHAATTKITAFLHSHLAFACCAYIRGLHILIAITLALLVTVPSIIPAS